MEQSKLHKYSIGIVARAKLRNSDQVEIFPIEINPASVGEVTDNTEELAVKGLDGDGRAFEGSIKTTPSITATWLPGDNSNRITPPDVQRNEYVMIYQYANVNNKYYWTTLKNGIRLLETVGWWFSGTTDPNTTEQTDENGYCMSVSTHDKLVSFSTSKANGETVRYDIQFNTEDATLTITDDLGQHIMFDSLAGKIQMTAEELIHLLAPLIHFECKQFLVDATTSIDFNTPIVNISDKLVVGGHTLLNSTSVMKGRSNFQGGIGGTNPADLKSPIDFYGTVNQIGDWHAEGNITVNGNITATGDVNWNGRPF
jgi:hypothetical protein